MDTEFKLSLENKIKLPTFFVSKIQDVLPYVKQKMREAVKR